MKNKSAWLLTGIALAAALTVASKNFAASVCIGAGAGMLLMVLTSLETDQKRRS